MAKKFPALKQTAKRKEIGNCAETKKSGELKVKGPSTLKSGRFTGGYE